MIKKSFLLAAVLSQLAISCSSNDNDYVEPSLNEQIAKIISQPYSKLSPADQKVKLEAEANEMLVQMDKSKSSGAIEAMENLNRLLKINAVDILKETEDDAEAILNTTEAYGIYTWNNAVQKWEQTASTNELKFIFPAKNSQTTNNASFSAKNNSTTGNGILTIDGNEAAVFNESLKYSDANEIPDEFTSKMALNDGYIWEMSGKKNAVNTTKASLLYKGKSLLDFNAGSTAQIDALLENDNIISYRGKANGLFKIMDNFAIVADTDLESEALDKNALNESLVYPTNNSYNNPDFDFKAYYVARNNYNQKQSQGTAANFNKNSKLALVSRKDGTKIADIIMRSEPSDYSPKYELPVWNSQTKYWYTNGKGEMFVINNYEEVYYLKFNDSTEAKMSTYFSSGFEALVTKFNDFTKAFNK